MIVNDDLEKRKSKQFRRSFFLAFEFSLQNFQKNEKINEILMRLTLEKIITNLKATLITNVNKSSVFQRYCTKKKPTLFKKRQNIRRRKYDG